MNQLGRGRDRPAPPNGGMAMKVAGSDGFRIMGRGCGGRGWE